uniref:Aquaporin 14 n=1 Tax=Malacocephalus occidentalis TaxID=630739 RepID=A0A7D3Q6X4_9TELE|nr:aquaporin 14 [Malacocephalus occidentalis]
MTLRELRSRQFWRAVLAELLGTLVLVSTMLGASVPGPGEPPGGPLYPGLAICAVIVTLGHCFGEISGAQVNPSVTLSMLATRKVDLVRALVYVGAQCLGAFLATGALYLALPRKSTAEVFVNRVARFSGAGMNPARALGPAIITGFWENHWVYWIGPVTGGVLAGVSHEFLFAHSASRQKLVACLTCKDVDMVETASVSRSSLSTVTQNAGRAKQANKADGN